MLQTDSFKVFWRKNQEGEVQADVERGVWVYPFLHCNFDGKLIHAFRMAASILILEEILILLKRFSLIQWSEAFSPSCPSQCAPQGMGESCLAEMMSCDHGWSQPASRTFLSAPWGRLSHIPVWRNLNSLLPLITAPKSMCELLSLHSCTSEQTAPPLHQAADELRLPESPKFL